MINEKCAKLYCKEDISKIYAYKEAISDKNNLWHCHHCLGLVFPKEKLIEMGLYYDQSAEMLMFVTRSQHQKLHFITNGRRVGNGVPWNIGKFGAENHKSVSIVQLTKDGQFIRKWSASMEVERELGIDNGNINRCCNGKRKSAGGFKWVYASDYQRKSIS